MEGGFFLQALVFLSAAVISVPIAKKLGLGSVLGYLIAGIIIGPYLFGFLGEGTDEILHFAEFGVVLMLFVIGLELEPKLLWKMRAPILGLGGLQVLVSGSLIFVISWMLSFSWQISLAFGCMFALSSTAIVLQTLNEKNLFKTSGGQSSFSVLLFQDIAVIPMLAIFPLLGSGSAENAHPSAIAHFDTWIQILIVLIVIAGIIVSGKYVIGPFFRIVAQVKMREIFTAAALLLVIGIAALMGVVGLSPALGTFLAGVVLANSEYRHALESDIEPFKGLLLGLFFIAVGASINFGLIVEKPDIIFGIVFGLMTLKAMILFVLGKFFSLRTDQNFLFSLGLSGVGEFAFVLATFALQQNIMDPEIVAIIIVVVAISMALTPLLFVINEKILQPNFGTQSKEEKTADSVEEQNRVIIAGFGRFGSIVGRMLRANGISHTVLDFDSDRVELLRKLGFKVYYGDASRYDMLHAAGAEHADLLIVSLGSREKTLELVETAKKHFPRLKLIVRAFDRPDAMDLIEHGVENPYRENVDTALRMSVDVLQALGIRAHHAHRSAQLFRRYDDESVHELKKARKEGNSILSVARRRIEELEKMIVSDGRHPELNVDEGWDPESLKNEVQGKS